MKSYFNDNDIINLLEEIKKRLNDKDVTKEEILEYIKTKQTEIKK